MLKTKQLFKRSRAITLASILFLSQLTASVSPLLITSSANALDTATLFPNGQGTYTAWDGNEDDVDETGTPDCEDNNTDGDDNVSTSTTSSRESVLISLTDIPNGSTITGVSVEVAYRDGNSSGADGTFQTFARLNGTDADSGVNLIAVSSNCISTMQTIDVTDVVKGAGTTLEVGVLKTSTDTSEVWVGAIRAVVTYTPAQVLQPDLTATKTNNVSGNAVIGQPFNWTIRVQNTGAASATFTNNEEILRDNRPDNNVSDYSNSTVTAGGGATGTITCTNSGSGSLDPDLNCVASGTVIIPVGGYFDITFSATPSSTGSLANPRSGGSNVCRVDRDTNVAESNENNNDCQNSVNVGFTPAVANPALAQACGLDIALVIDNSGSISDAELAQIKAAMTAFTTAFAGTPTEFSVTKFATNASVVQPFTANIADVNTAINGIPQDEGSTNWQQGLTQAQTTLTNRPDKPDLVIFASDGNPNRINNPAQTVGEPIAVNSAVIVANSIKTGGARILALGVGNELDTPNLQAISGISVNTGDVLTSDVITSDFATLATDLAEFASQTCGGTITTTKLIDADGNLATTDDRTATQGWTIDINGGSDPAATVTDAQGKTPAVDVDPSTYSVNETPQAGYQMLLASCSGATNNGSQSTNSVIGVAVAANSIVSCTFINGPVFPTLTLVKTVTNNNGGTKTSADFQAKIDGNNVAWSTAITLGVGPHTASETTLPTYTASNWGTDCAPNGTITLALGDNKTCTITNNDNKPKLTLIKELGEKYGSDVEISDWVLTAIGALDPSTDLSGASGTTSGDEFKADTYTLGESSNKFSPGQFTSSWTCVGGNNAVNDVLVLSLGQDVTCTITNTGKQPKLTVVKEVTNDDGGTQQVADFPLFVANNITNVQTDVVTGASNGFNVGEYTVGEMYVDSQYSASFSGNCDANGQVTLDLGDDKTCTITNDDISPTLTLKKKVTNDNSGTSVPSDWILTATPSDNTKPTLSGNGKDGFVDKQAFANITYTLSESGPTDYSANSWVCEGGTLIGNELTLELGTDVICVITNDDIPHPEITVEKFGPATAAAGTTVNYLFHVSNTGDTRLGKVQIEDDIAGVPTYMSGDIGSDQILSPGEVWVYSVEYTIPAGQVADVVNTVETCGLPMSRVILVDDSISRLAQNNIVLNPNVCDSDSHTLEIPQVLGTTTTTTPAKLVNTGSRASVLRLVLPLLLIGLVGLVARRQSQTTSK